MSGAKLVDFVLHFVKNSCFVILGAIVLDSLSNMTLGQTVHDLDSTEVNNDASGCAARDVFDFVGLDRDFNFGARG